MPLFNGVCIPPICVSIKYDKTGATMSYIDTSVVPEKTVKRPKLWTADLEKEAYAAHTTDANVDCDGCTCRHWAPPPAAWTLVPPFRVTNPLVPGYHVVMQITGLQVKVHWGQCMPPGTQVQGADGKWRPLATPGGGDGHEDKSDAPPKKKGGKRRAK